MPEQRNSRLYRIIQLNRGALDIAVNSIVRTREGTQPVDNRLYLLCTDTYIIDQF